MNANPLKGMIGKNVFTEPLSPTEAAWNCRGFSCDSFEIQFVPSRIPASYIHGEKSINTINMFNGDDWVAFVDFPVCSAYVCWEELI